MRGGAAGDYEARPLQLAGHKPWKILSTKIARRYCCIMGVSFSAVLFLRAAALISAGTVVISSMVVRQGGVQSQNLSFYRDRAAEMIDIDAGIFGQAAKAI